VVYERGSTQYLEALNLLRQAGSKLADRVKAIVVIEVREARPVISPAYDDGATEAEIITSHRARFARLYGDA
jgi:uncharacterized protein